MPLELTFLGTGNAFAPTRYWSSFLLNDRVCSTRRPRCSRTSRSSGKTRARIDAIFISHFHGDHYFGLPFLTRGMRSLRRARGR